MKLIFAKRPGRLKMSKAVVVMITLALAASAQLGCSSQSASQSKKDSIVMKNKELVSLFFQRFSNGEIDQAFSLVSDDVSWWVPGELPFSGTKTKGEYMQVVGSIQKGFPSGLQLDATSMIAEGNQVAVEVASNGKHVNGKTYANKYHFLITIEEGKIVKVKEYMDTIHLFQLIQP